MAILVVIGTQITDKHEGLCPGVVPTPPPAYNLLRQPSPNTVRLNLP